MDGKNRDTSMRLVLASVPLQALMMVGAAGLLFGGASASPAQEIQITVQPAPAGGPASGFTVVPLEGCQADGPWPSPLPAGPAANCVSGEFYFGLDQSGAVQLPLRCCGG
jgi:hypothetical protein